MPGSPISFHDHGREVALWVHPQGRVWGTVFALFAETADRHDSLLDILNEDLSFVAFRLGDPQEVRLYNRATIVRVQYPAMARQPEPGQKRLSCRVMLKDGSVFDGTVVRSLPKDRSRLFDFLNLEGEKFARIYLDDGSECLINKAFILSVTPSHEPSHGNSA